MGVSMSGCERKVERGYGPLPYVLEASLRGLGGVCRHVVHQAQKSRPEAVATLDQDAAVVGSSKRAAAMTYQGRRGYQPMVVLWAEQDVVVADELANDLLRTSRGSA